MNFAEMQLEINALMKDHEQHATKAYIHLQKEKATRLLKSTTEKLSDTTKQPSIHSFKNKKPNDETISKNIAHSIDNNSF